jgi:hypothetical protein
MACRQASQQNSPQKDYPAGILEVVLEVLSELVLATEPALVLEPVLEREPVLEPRVEHIQPRLH